MTLATTTTEHLLDTPEGCIEVARTATKNYRECMLLVVEKWTAPKDWGGLGLPIEQLAEAIQRSPKTLKSDYVAVLRKEGRLPKGKCGKAADAYKKDSGRPASSVEKPIDVEVVNVDPTTQDPEERIQSQEVEILEHIARETKLLTENHELRKRLQAGTPGDDPSPTEDAEGGSTGQLDPDSYRGSLAKYWAECVEGRDEPDSSRAVSQHIGELYICIQQEITNRDGWSEGLWEAFRQDLSALARLCANQSAQYRADIDARVEEARANLSRALSGGGS